jgi:hypothetical protein
MKSVKTTNRFLKVWKDGDHFVCHLLYGEGILALRLNHTELLDIFGPDLA